VFVDVGATDGSTGSCLVWRLPQVMRSISSSIVGGGLGDAAWVINLSVDRDYQRLDPDAHLSYVAKVSICAGAASR
jgi:adenosylcobinamide amidohydrolase